MSKEVYISKEHDTLVSIVNIQKQNTCSLLTDIGFLLGRRLSYYYKVQKSVETIILDLVAHDAMYYDGAGLIISEVKLIMETCGFQKHRTSVAISNLIKAEKLEKGQCPEGDIINLSPYSFKSAWKTLNNSSLQNKEAKLVAIKNMANNYSKICGDNRYLMAID